VLLAQLDRLMGDAGVADPSLTSLQSAPGQGVPAGA
jgi:hypothetical protein